MQVGKFFVCMTGESKLHHPDRIVLKDNQGARPHPICYPKTYLSYKAVSGPICPMLIAPMQREILARITLQVGVHSVLAPDEEVEPEMEAPRQRK
jgi:hypothetical protein